MVHFSADCRKLLVDGKTLGIVEGNLGLESCGGMPIYGYLQAICVFTGPRVVSLESIVLNLVGERNMLRSRWLDSDLLALFEQLEDWAIKSASGVRNLPTVHGRFY